MNKTYIEKDLNGNYSLVVYLHYEYSDIHKDGYIKTGVNSYRITKCITKEEYLNNKDDYDYFKESILYFDCDLEEIKKNSVGYYNNTCENLNQYNSKCRYFK